MRGRAGVARRYESWAERQIREATERGEFDNLPGAGKPLRDLSRDGEDWFARSLMEREKLPAVLPSGLALRREAERIDETVASEPTQQAVREIVEDLNARIRESYRHTDRGPRIVVRTVNVDQVLAEWRSRRSNTG